VNALIVINDAPYGSERPYNAFRVASTLPAGTEVEGAHRSTMEELADWVQWPDRTLVF
jgi:sulfur relay (sulfurtransferase) complex TusBCD TusD component (DsrE family)